MKTELKIIAAYLKANIFFALIVFYFFVSGALKLLSAIDIMPRCIFSSLFNIHCPGCGLSKAFLSIVTFNFPTAWHYNPLIFIVLPAGTYYVITDFLKFRNNKPAN